ncbi:MAG: PAS domain S-box protein [Oligoflexus sp.]|nr:PAS domain S-box protein [Pseudopedobacter sp.]
MNYHKLLNRQISKYLPEELQENEAIKIFLNVIDDSYIALQRDKELAERAFGISEEEYIALNQKLNDELTLKKLSVDKLKEAVGEIGGNSENSDDLLSIAKYLHQQVGKRKNAEEVFTSLINNTQSGILLEDENRKIVFTNQLFCDLFQIPVLPDLLKGADCSDSAQQSKFLFKQPEEFVLQIDQILKDQILTSDILEFADGRILTREYIPIFIENEYKGHFWNYTDITEKRKIEESIQQSELKNRLIMNAALDAIITIDKKGIITFWNPQAEKIFGWKEKEVLGKRLTDNIIPPYHKNGHENGMEGYRQTGEGPVLNKILEMPAVNKEGKEFPIELSIIPVKQGDTEFFCSFIRDISDRKRSEEALKSSQELWQFALEGAGDGVWEFNFETKEVFFSKQYKKMLGYEEEEFKNEINEWHSRIHPDDLNIIVQTDKEYEQKLITNHQCEYRIEHKNGNYIWILDRGMIVSYTDDGKTKRIIGTHTDITERKLSEQALKIKEEKYRSILANMNLGLLEVDNDDIIQYANQSFCQISGYQIDELIGHKASHLLLSAEDKEIIIDKNNQRKTGISDAYEIPLKDKNGQTKWLLISGAPRYNDNGELVGSVGIHLDITAQKHLEIDLTNARDAAQASTYAKELFLANMSHEIRTPMNAILGMANQLNKTKLDKNQQFFLDTIHSASDNLIIIINDILDLSKIDSGKLTIEKIGFEPQKVIDKVMQVLQHRAEEKGLKFTNSFFDLNISPILIGDPHRLEQVLLNLISNAIKFTFKGSVDIICKAVKNVENYQEIEVTVTDTGIGMEEVFIDKLFDKFSQEDNSVTRKYGGTGLGMSICKELLTLMGGEILVSSKKNIGSSISILIKMEKGLRKDLPHHDTLVIDTNILKGKNILVTDDNEINRLLASTILKNFGANIIEAQNGLEAINQLRDNDTIDLILMDLQMPVIDGLESTEIIRGNIDEHIPIIALTAYALKGDNQKCFDAGMNDYISKPFEEIQLLRVVTKWLNKETDRKFQPILILENKDLAQTQPLFDLAQIQEISRGNSDFVEKMISLFIDQTPKSVQEIKSAYQNQDFDTVRKIAHRMKPSLLNLGIKSLGNVITDIEHHSKDDQTSKKLEGLIDKVESVLEEVVIGLGKQKI